MKFWHGMTESDRHQVMWTVIAALTAVVVVLYAIAASRGHDVDYFKERLALQEQRLNYMDQKIDGIAQKQHEQRDLSNELRRMQEAQQRQLEEHQKWVEFWKTLPQVPKPRARPSSLEQPLEPRLLDQPL